MYKNLQVRVILIQTKLQFEEFEEVKRLAPKRLCTARRTPRPVGVKSLSQASTRKTEKSVENNSLLLTLGIKLVSVRAKMS